jgi:hypothetical protein
MCTQCGDTWSLQGSAYISPEGECRFHSTLRSVKAINVKSILAQSILMQQMTPDEYSNLRDDKGKLIFHDFRLAVLRSWYRLDLEERKEAKRKGPENLKQVFENCLYVSLDDYVKTLCDQHHGEETEWRTGPGRIVGVKGLAIPMPGEGQYSQTLRLEIIVLLHWGRAIRRSNRIRELPEVQTEHTYSCKDDIDLIAEASETPAIVPISGMASWRESRDSSFVIPSQPEEPTSLDMSSGFIVPSIETSQSS